MITSIRLDRATLDEYGLAEPDLHGLRQVVVLAGPNGGGKTRLLRAVLDRVNRASAAHGTLPSLRKQLLQNEQFARENLRAPIRVVESAQKLADAEAAVDLVSWTACPPSIALLDTADVAFARAMIPDLNARAPESVLQTIAEARAERVNEHAQALFNASHPAFAGHDGVRSLGRVAGSLGDLLKELLGSSLGFGIAETQVIATLFGRPYIERELSTGQLLLLTWSLLLHERTDTLKRGSILFVDEPERQLHPCAAVDLLDRLLAAVGDSGQLWIATHSPAIVAHFGRQSVYHVADHRARYSGSRIDVVMDGLLGGPESRRDFSAFLREADELSLLRFAAESLFPPGVIGHHDGDRQETQFGDLTRRWLASSNSKLRILDYAAGRGRFAVALADTLPPDLLKRVDYYAFNDRDHDDHHADCVRNVARLHASEAEARVSFELSDFFGEGAMDIVVMSNFLHEIEPAEWRTHFRRASQALRDGGVVLIMEDQEPPVGELPTRHGFLVLDLEGLRVLFGGTQLIRPLHTDSRLTAFEVPKDRLVGFDGGHLNAALESTVERARRELLKLRGAESERNPQSRGRRHAFYALLYTSARMLLDERQ